MKKIITFLMLCCITALFAPPETRAQSAQTVNESGGAGLNDGLKFVVNTNGALAVYRDDRAQYFPGSDWSDVGRRGTGVSLTFRFSNGGNYSLTKSDLQVCSTTPVVQTGNTYKTSISGYVNSTLSDDKFFVTLDVTYTHPDNYFMIDYIVRSPLTLSAAGQTVHMYLDHDAMILGCDASYGYISENNTGQFIGDYRPVNCGTCPGPGNLTSAGKYKNPSSHGFKTNGRFRSYYTGVFNLRNNMSSTLELSNTYNSTKLDDDGIAVEFTAGPFTQPNQTLIRSVAHCYGNDKTEFDNLVINVPAAPAASTPVTLNFTSAEFSEIEGDHTAQNIKIRVSGGILASDQICSFILNGGTAVENTDYSYVRGFTIPAGNYTTPQEFVLNNITITDNSVCNDSKWTNLTIEAPSICNDMLQLGNQSSAKITIKDDEPRPEIMTFLQDTAYDTGDVVPSLSLISNVAGATVTWTNSNPAIGLAESGTGDIPSFTAINTSANPITATITVTASKECAGASQTFTITVNSKFNITYDYANGVAPATANPTEFFVANLPMNIWNAPTRTGYTFDGWTCSALDITTPQNPFTIPTGTTQDIALVADWGSGANEYNITFDVPISIANSYSDQTYTYEDYVSITDPEILGYTFKGWKITNDSVSSPPIDPKTNVSWNPHTIYGNLTFSVTAPSITDTTCWLPNDYSIEYDYDGGVAPAIPNPVIYNALTLPIHLNAPTRNGYTFKGWTITNTDSDDIAVALLSFTQGISTGYLGNLLCKANWEENGYSISYELNGATHPQTPISYLFTNQTTVADPTLAGYTFRGWTIENDSALSPVITPTMNVTFGPNTVFGDLTFKVSAPSEDGGENDNWEQITYTITYHLNGGTHGADHPESYTVTDNVSISVPTKSGYTFAGWTIESDSTSSPLPTSGNPTTFGASNGIYGNLTFTAKWTTDAYTITYNPGAADASFTNINTNPGTYDIENTPITLTDGGAKRNGYSFDEWKITSSETEALIVEGMEIPAGTHGNLTSTAKWTINNYKIEFFVPDTVANPNSNRSYTYEDSVTIANPTMPGYTFTGWTIVNDSVSSPAIYPINSAWSQHTVYGNVKFSVTDPTVSADPTVPSNWNTIEYDITYELNGGTPPATANPTQYDVQTPTITLKAPTRPGYTFRDWTIESDSTAVTFTNPTNTIPAGSYGDLTCTANWSMDSYRITYEVASGIMHAQTPQNYTFEEDITIDDPILTGYTFTGWTITNDAPSAPLITPTKNVHWAANTVYGNLTMKVEYPTGDSDVTDNWTKNKHKVTYYWNNDTDASTTDPNHTWNTTVTVLGKPANMVYTDAMYLGWSSTAIALVTTQDQEDALPTLIQAGNTFVMPDNDTTFYAVWAIDAGGPNGGPDGTPDYKQVAINYLPSSSVTASSGTYPENVMFNKNTTGTVAGNTGNLQAANKILMGWSTNNVASISATGTLPSGMYDFGASISIGTVNITLYAVWADDSNRNGTADFKETPSTPVTDGSKGGAGGSPTRPGRTRSLGRSPEAGSNLITSDMMTRSSDNTWNGWKSEWDNVNMFDVAFADDCEYVYIINMDTLHGSRAYHNGNVDAVPFDEVDEYFYSYVAEDSWLVWSYEGDWKSDDNYSFLINAVNDLDQGSIKANRYKGTGQILDSVFIEAGTYFTTDYIWDSSLNKAVHASSADLENGVFDWDWNDGVPRGEYDPQIKFNPELITKLNNGGKLILRYEVKPVSGSTTGYYPGTATLFKRVYRRFEPTADVVSQYVSTAGKWDVEIEYGSPDLKRSINGGSWKSAYAPLSNWEQLAVNDGVDIRLRDPGDECGKIIHFNEIKTPTIQRKVTIHSIDEVIKTYPEADMEHYVEGNKEFRFVITFADEALKVMAHGFYSGKKEELIGDSIGVNTFQYTVHQVVEPMNIYITAEPASGTANDVINGSSNVWTYGNTLYIRSIDGAAKADIYNISGSLLKQLNLNSDITEEVMERGAYVIKLGNEHYKVIIR